VGVLPYPSAAYSWFVVGVLTLAYISSYIDRQVLSLLVGPVRRDLRISDTQVSLLMGASFALFYTLLGLPIARLADSRSRRGIIALGVATWSLMTAACGLTKTFVQLLVARVGVGAGEAALSPPAYSLLADYFPRERLATAISIYSTGIFLGSGLATIIGGAVLGLVSTEGLWQLPVIGTIYPWQSVFFIVGLPGLLIALLIITTVREVPRRSVNGLASRRGAIPIPEIARFVRLHWRVFFAQTFGFGLLTLVGQGILAWTPTFFIRTYHWTAAAAGVRFGMLLIVFGTIGIVSGGRASDALVRRGYTDAQLRVGLIGALGVALLGALFPLMPSGGLALALLGPVLFLVSFPLGAAVASIQEIVPNEMRAQISAMYLFVANLIGLTLGPTSVALFTDFLFGRDDALRFSLALVSAIAAVLSLIVLRSGLAPYRRLAASLARPAR
jgi:MFS family permease